MLLHSTIRYEIITKMSRIPEVRRVVLFGSRARGDADERSDIDMAVEAPKANDRTWIRIDDELRDLQTLLPVDIIRWETASEDLRTRITQEGVPLYDRSEIGVESSQPRQSAGQT